MNKDYFKKTIQETQIQKLASSNRGVYPSFTQMAKNVGGDIVKTVQNITSGEQIKTDDAEVNRRKSICNSCEFFNSAQERCTKCGCYVAIKVYVKASGCPLGKW
jgi:hypothetical protein